MPNLPSIIRIGEHTFQRIPIVEDGNCFFRAVSFWVHGDQGHHKDIRNLVVSHIMSQWSRYKHFIVGDESYDNRIRSRYDYSTYMRENGRYGGAQECVAVSEVFQVRLKIFNLNHLGSPQVYGHVFDTTFTFLFSGHQDSGHFDVIVRHDHVTLTIY